MDPKSQEYFNKVTAKDINTLTEEEKSFLRARRSYLKSYQLEDFKDILETTPDYTDSSSPNYSYEEMWKKAKSMGYKGLRINKSALEEYIKQK